MPIASSNLLKLQSTKTNLVFVDDYPTQNCINGHKVLSYEEFINTPAANKYILVAISNSHIRKNITDRCSSDGISSWSAIADTVVITNDVQIGEGAILSHFSLLTCNITIGKSFHANHYSHVSHDCVIGDYVTFAPGVRCNGNVHIHDHAYIGSGAIIKQGTPDAPLVTEREAVVGMGAVVTKSVPAGATVVGNPAKPLIRS